MKKRSVRAVLGAALATLAVVALTSTSVGAVPAGDASTGGAVFTCDQTAAAVGAAAVSGSTASNGFTCDTTPPRQGNGPTASCQGTFIFAWPNTGYDLGAYGADIWSNTGPVSLTLPVATTPGGRYSVTAVGYDGFFGRSGEQQPHEQFRVDFLNSGGGVVGSTSLSTGDLIDGTDEATWSGSLGDVEFGADVTQIRAVHSFQGPGVTNTVQPICVGLSLLKTPPTTTAAPTTTVAPTTTAPAEVESAVAVAPPAAAVEGTPTFTG